MRQCAVRPAEQLKRLKAGAALAGECAQGRAMARGKCMMRCAAFAANLVRCPFSQDWTRVAIPSSRFIATNTIDRSERLKKLKILKELKFLEGDPFKKRVFFFLERDFAAGGTYLGRGSGFGFRQVGFLAGGAGQWFLRVFHGGGLA